MRIIKGIRNRILARMWWIYRLYLVIFYTKQKKYFVTRKGKCNRCGGCCSGCGWDRGFDEKGNHICKDIESAFRNLDCGIFPRSPLDKKRLGLEKKCGWYWESERVK